MDVIRNKDVRSFLRLKNVQNLLDILLRKGNAARVELSKMTGLTKTTISSITRELISKGILEETSPTLNKNKIGRTITPLRIRKDAAYTIGVDLSRHHLSAVMMNTHGKIILRKKGPSYGNVGPQKVMNNLFRIIDGIFDSFSRSRRIDALGIGMPGPLDIEKGIVIEPPKFFGWKNVPLCEIVSQRYSVPVWIENDANCAALAEKWYGNGKNVNAFLYILLNEGIGAGIFIDGEIYKGSSNYEGEIGHTIVRRGNKISFLENLPEYERIVKSIRIAARETKNADNIAVVSDELLDKIGHLIGESFATTSNILNPEKIFIGGELAIFGNKILKPIRESFYKYSLGEKWGKLIPIELSEIHRDAISMGAATYSMRRFIIEKAMGK